VRIALFMCYTWNPGQSAQSGLVAKNLFAECFEYFATHVFYGVEQSAQSRDFVQVCIYAELQGLAIAAGTADQF
jgi:hypothetical protein